jgi:hypothetical protein
MVDFGGGKSPCPPHLAPGQLVSLGKLEHFGRHEVQIRRESIDIEVLIRHRCSAPAHASTSCLLPACATIVGKTCLDAAAQIHKHPPP